MTPKGYSPCPYHVGQVTGNGPKVDPRRPIRDRALRGWGRTRGSRRLEGMSPASEKSRSATIASHLGIMVAVAAVMGVLTAGLVIPLAGLASVGAQSVAEGLDALATDLEPGDLPQRTQILDSQGTVIATLYDENRVTVSLDKIAKPMRQAILSIEDDRFYKHGAIDVKGTMRALVTNQTNGGMVQGGSSITQQLVKLTLQNQARESGDAEALKAASEDTYGRKLRELGYAIALEKKHSKDWILERYLNTAFFGAGAHGIQAAARRYFSKNASALNFREAATLAGLVKSPNAYNPIDNPDRAKTRRNVVLDRMASLNVITSAQSTKLKARPLGLKVTRTANGCTESRAPFFCDYVLNYLEADTSLGKTVEDRVRLLRTGGLTINTTVDLQMQDSADAAVRANVFPTDQAIGGLAMVQPGTGEVRALAQSRPMGDDVKAGQTYLNYVVNQKYGDSAGFSGGSTFKAFTLAAAISQGISLTTTIDAPKTLTINMNKFKNCNDESFVGTWTLRNSTTSGQKNLYTGTRESVNTFYAKLLAMTGVCEPFKLAKSMGVNLDNPHGDARGLGAELIPSFTLGSPDTSPLEMAEAYATFAARGKHCDSRPVNLITDSQGKAVKKYKPKCSQVMGSAVADAVNDVLAGVQSPGGFGARFALGGDSAAKTGTAQNTQSVWYVGYTPQLATASMIAGANSQGQPISLVGQTIGGLYRSSAAASGSGFAGPMWYAAMSPIGSRITQDSFVAPSGSSIQGVLAEVPTTTGMTKEEAIATLEDAGFQVQESGRYNSSVERGLIAGSRPGGGATLSSGDTVQIYTSTGYVPPPKSKPGKGKGKKKNGRRERD